MTDTVIPFWTVGTESAPAGVPTGLLPSESVMSSAELARLRRVLAAWSEEAPLLLERHELPAETVPLGGQVVAAGSPILASLREVVGALRPAAGSSGAASSVTTETLYRLVVPREIAQQLNVGTATMMRADGGAAIRGSVLSGGKIVANAKFAPVAAASGTSATATGGAGAAAAGGALVAAGPLLVLVAATAASIYAEEQRRRALERLQQSLDALKKDALDAERDRLNGATWAISKATALLADEARLGSTLGIDSAVHTIDTAVETAERRIGEWERTLAGIGDGGTPDALRKVFTGIEQDDGGEFVAKVRMAAFAIAMKRRVAVLQAAEHMQLNADLSLARFSRALEADVARLDSIGGRLSEFLGGLAALSVRAPSKVHDVMFGRNEVRRLLEWSPRLHRIAVDEQPQLAAAGDVEISIVINDDGSARVLSPVLLPG